ncbi:MAG: hypothetical protein ACHQ51_12615 [Elusimicrobiota bacterium]
MSRLTRVMAISLLSAACAGAPSRPAEPGTPVFGGLVRYHAAPGWTRSPSSIWGDETVVLSSGTETTFRLHLRRGDPDKDDLVQGLKNAPWDAASGGPAGAAETIRVADAEYPLWRRASAGIREEPGQDPTYFSEAFCVVPLSDHFLVLVFATSDARMPPSPAALAERESGWRAMLASLRVER